jgi:hypothetical protein
MSYQATKNRKLKCMLLSERNQLEKATVIPTLTFWERQTSGDSRNPVVKGLGRRNGQVACRGSRGRVVTLLDETTIRYPAHSTSNPRVTPPAHWALCDSGVSVWSTAVMSTLGRGIDCGGRDSVGRGYENPVLSANFAMNLKLL